jgi:hypothetical protein
VAYDNLQWLDCGFEAFLSSVHPAMRQMNPAEEIGINESLDCI